MMGNDRHPSGCFYFLGGETMKKFMRDRVKEIAIDLPNQQQIYIADQKNKQFVMDKLMELGYKGNLAEIKKQPDYCPVVVNTLEKVFFVIPIGLMACAIQSGAKSINYQKMLEWIEVDEGLNSL
jgi:hypothetical protein